VPQPSRHPHPTIKDMVVDEAIGRTDVVIPSRVLADGEICRAIRQELLRLGGEFSKWDNTVRITRRRPPRPGGEPRRLCPPEGWPP
jgi:hypothetical protein